MHTGRWLYQAIRLVNNYNVAGGEKAAQASELEVYGNTAPWIQDMGGK